MKHKINKLYIITFSVLFILILSAITFSKDIIGIKEELKIEYVENVTCNQYFCQVKLRVIGQGKDFYHRLQTPTDYTIEQEMEKAKLEIEEILNSTTIIDEEEQTYIKERNNITFDYEV